MKPGIYSDLTSLQYHTGPGVSKSGLDALHRSPAHYWHEYGQRQQAPEDLDGLEDVSDDDESRALVVGRAFHALMLERGTFAERFAVQPKFGRRKADLEAKETWLQRHAGRTIIRASEVEALKGMREACERHPVVGKLLRDGVAEQSAYVIDPESGVLVRCRPDYLRKDGIIVDLKTARDGSPEAFSREVASRRYHVQHAFYTDILAALGVKVRGFVFLVVEKTPPYEIGVYTLDTPSVEVGREEYRADLAVLRQCQQANRWPGYCEQIVPISLPAWRLPKQ